MRNFLVYLVLRSVRALARVFYDFEVEWVGENLPPDPWEQDFRLVTILNHTSLYEILMVGLVPVSFIRRMAYDGVLPVANKTLDRPFIGKFWRLVAGQVVGLSRERDQTWAKMLDSVRPGSMVMILPEGRMKRAGGLDSHGRKMTVRSGIGDLLHAMQDGKVLIAYSQGLHHIQIPGETFPRLFKTVRLKLEVVDLIEYKNSFGIEADLDSKEYLAQFKRAVVADLTARRDLHCTSDHGEG